MSQDSSNEELLDILGDYDLRDDADVIESELGVDGLDAIRDAEAGIY